MVLFIHIDSYEVIVRLIGSNPLMEVFGAGKVFQIKEFPFNSTVDCFDIAVVQALGGIRLWRQPNASTVFSNPSREAGRKRIRGFD